MPYEIHLVRFPSDEALAHFTADEERQRGSKLTSVDLAHAAVDLAMIRRTYAPATPCPTAPSTGGSASKLSASQGKQEFSG